MFQIVSNACSHAQGPGARLEDHQERGQVQGGRQARGQRARKAAGEGPPGQAVSHHRHHHHRDHHNCHHHDDQILLPTSQNHDIIRNIINMFSVNSLLRPKNAYFR